METWYETNEMLKSKKIKYIPILRWKKSGLLEHIMEQINEINSDKLLIIKFNSILYKMHDCNVLKYPSRYEEIKTGRHRKYLQFTNKNMKKLCGKESKKQFFKYFISKFTKDERRHIWLRNGYLERYMFILESPTYHRRILNNMISELVPYSSKN